MIKAIKNTTTAFYNRIFRHLQTKTLINNVIFTLNQLSFQWPMIKRIYLLKPLSTLSFSVIYPSRQLLTQNDTKVVLSKMVYVNLLNDFFNTFLNNDFHFNLTKSHDFFTFIYFLYFSLHSMSTKGDLVRFKQGSSRKITREQ